MVVPEPSAVVVIRLWTRATPNNKRREPCETKMPLPSALYQGTASAVPKRNAEPHGFSRCRG